MDFFSDIYENFCKKNNCDAQVSQWFKNIKKIVFEFLFILIYLFQYFLRYFNFRQKKSYRCPKFDGDAKQTLEIRVERKRNLKLGELVEVGFRVYKFGELGEEI